MSSVANTSDSTKTLIIGFFMALFVLLVILTRPFPGRVQTSTFITAGIGIIALLFARGKESLLKHLLRDIGIAFIVAVVVTVIYEYSTRTLEERATLLSVIDKAMGENVPLNVWTEVKQEILQRQRIRRNVDIEVKILRSAQLSTGEHVTAPKGEVILWMRYGYDLYGMGAGGSAVPVQHQLGFEMWDEKTKLPRFESISVISDQGSNVKMYVGDELKRIYDGKGSIRLDGSDIVHLPASNANQAVRIVTERFELVNSPGSYNLVMPELTARLDDSAEPSIKVAVTEIPPDLDAELNTYYAAHAFTQPDKSRSLWLFKNTFLPGQGFTLIVKPKFPPKDEPSISTQ